MHNANIPTHTELPTSEQLLKSTVAAIAAAGVILVTIVLPSEYAIDPTGVGRLLGLTQMGSIKQSLGKEALEDALLPEGAERTYIGAAPKPAQPAKAAATAKPEASVELKRLQAEVAKLLAAAAAPEQAVATPNVFAAARVVLVASDAVADEPAPAPAKPGVSKDEITFELKSNEGTEYKMEMVAGAETKFEWRVDGGVVNYDMHGTPGSGPETSYLKGRGVDGNAGTLTAGFDGSHGWFWRNRGTDSVTITLRTEGAYKNLHKIK